MKTGTEVQDQGSAGGDDLSKEISTAEYEKIVADELSKPEGAAGDGAGSDGGVAAGEKQPEAEKPKTDGEQKKPEGEKTPEEPVLSDEDKAVLKEMGIEDPKAVPAAMLSGALSVIRTERKKATDAQNTANLYASQNKNISKLYQDLKKQNANDPRAAIKTLKSRLTPEFLAQLPESTRKLVEDDDVQMATLALMQLAQGGAPDGAARPDGEAPDGAHDEERMTPEQVQEYRDEVQRQLDTAGTVIVEAGFKDFQTTYKSKDFLDWLRGVADQEAAMARKVAPHETEPARLSPTLARWWSPNPAGHIDILTRYNGHVAAKAAEADEAKKLKEQQDAMAGHGPVGKGAAGTGELSDDDIMSMSDEAFEAFDQKVRSGGYRK